MQGKEEMRWNGLCTVVVVGTTLMVSLMSAGILATPARSASGPIYGQVNFTSNQDLAQQASSGSGTASDPYIIRDLQVVSTGTGYNCLNVMDTDAYVVLRGITVTGMGEGTGIGLVNVSNATIEHCNIINAGISAFVLRNVQFANNNIKGAGIDIGHGWIAGAWSGNSRISIFGNRVTDCGYSGIDANNADNVTIFENVVRNCSNVGLAIQGSQNVLISDNNFTNNSNCISIWQSKGVTLVANQVVKSNGTGVQLDFSSDVMIHHNNFVNNTIQAQVSGNQERVGFSFGYPFGGNYWSNYTAADVFNGLEQNLSGPDGIWDKPLNVSSTVHDEYPLTVPFTRSNNGEPPAAAVVVLPYYGRPNKSFTLDASRTWDSEYPSFELEFRWDWNNDGTWDTPWSSQTTVEYTYTGPGNATVAMEARDREGRLNETTCLLIVDRLAPVLSTDFGPGKVTFTKSQPIWINWSCKEDLSGLANFQSEPWQSAEYFRVLVNGHELGDPACPVRNYMWMRGGDGYSMTSNLSINGLPDGRYVVLVQAADVAGNTAELRIVFEIHTNPFDPAGPYGPGPLLTLVAAMAIGAVIIVYLALRPRKGTPEASSVPAPIETARSNEQAWSDSKSG